jgi:hypothetical protein
MNSVLKIAGIFLAITLMWGCDSNEPVVEEPQQVVIAPEPEPKPAALTTEQIAMAIDAAIGETELMVETGQEPDFEALKKEAEESLIPVDGRVLTLVFRCDTDWSVVEGKTAIVSYCLVDGNLYDSCHEKEAKNIEPSAVFWRPDRCMFSCDIKGHHEITYLMSCK